MKLNINSNELKKKQEKEYMEALKNNDFNRLIKKVKITEEEAKMNTIKLLDTIDELNNCKNCKSIFECNNKVRGHVLFPLKDESKIAFTYVPCKYQKALDKKKKETNESVLDKARIKDIKPSKSRIEVIKWIKNYYDTYDLNNTRKGLYLHGNFGTGKTYLLAALLNELKEKYKISIKIEHVSGLIRSLKENFDLFEDKIFELENVDILLLDDIGAEKVTEWGRDEIIGTILETRMNKNMPTFFTSNLTIKELENHLSMTKDSEDILKAKRIIERVKYMTDDIELLGNNYRE